jgi:glycosyltransferase involved in cell wall biosynthesis
MRTPATDLRPRTKVAVILPCYNEEVSIGQTVRDFRAALPAAEIYVYDNNSVDGTVSAARAAGAIVRRESRQGKGHVVRRMFADIEADIYVMADGDATYEASAAPAMIAKLLDENLDMVVGRRRDQVQTAYRPGHRFGNALLTWCLAAMFGRQLSDILSGYRVFSRRFVKTFPSLSSGFEIETEISVHALQLCIPVGEVDTRYDARPEGSSSKLNTYRDGVRILLQMIGLFRQERPALFFGLLGATLAAISIILAVPLVVTYAETGLVPRFPTAILCTGLMILAFLSATSGVILDTVTRGRIEIRRLAYLTCGIPESTSTARGSATVGRAT